MGRFTDTLAIEGFDGADVADIDGTAPDGGGDLAKALGLWAKHPVFTSGELARLGNVGVNLTDYASYNLTAIPDLPDSYGSRLRQTLPSSDSATPPTGQYMEAWTYYAYATGDNLAHGPWTGNVSDLVGGATIGGVLQINSLTLHPNGQPAFVDIEVIGGDPSGEDLAHILFRSHASDLEGATPHVFHLDVDWDITDDPTTYAVPGGGFAVPAQITRLRIGANVAAIAVTPTPTPADFTPPGSGWTNLTGSDHVSQDVGTNSASTGVTIDLTLEATAGRYEWTFSELATDDGTFELVDPGSGGDEFVLLEVAVCKHDTDPIMYQMQGTFQHPIAGIPTIEFELWEYFSGGGGSRKLRPTYGPVFWSHDRAPDIQLDWDNDTKTLHGYLSDGVTDDEIFTFRVGVDTPQTGVAGDVADLDGVGSPGLSGLDLNFAALSLPLSWQLDQYAVCLPACVRPPDVPDPHDPPPFNPNQAVAIWVEKDGLPRPVRGPGVNVAVPKVFAEAAAAGRRIKGVWVQKNGVACRVLTLDSDQFPPPDGGPPPQYDPCEELDPTPGGTDFPPIGDIDPIPYAGGRFYGMQGYPVTMFNSIFNASARAVELPWHLTELAQAVARNGVIVGAQGGYKKFMTTLYRGAFYYSPDTMDAFIEEHGGSVGATMLAAQGSGNLACVYICDDQRVQKLWPTSAATGGGTGSGLSDTEVARIAAKWASVVPGLRLALRMRPRTLSGPIAGVDVLGAQYDGPKQVGKNIGDTVTSTDFRNWRDAELTELLSWGGSQQLILSPNYLHGGDGESGVQVYTGTIFDGRYLFGPDELVRLADGWFGDGGGEPDRIIGSCGYEYHPAVLTTPGVLDGCTYFRNGLMALTPL